MNNNNMNNKTPTKPKKASATNVQVATKTVDKTIGTAFNSILWLLTLALVVGVSVFNQVYGNHNPVIRLVVVIVAIVLAILTFLLTNQGRKFLKFSMEAMLELRKIYYPTRKEALQTSIIVVLISVLVSFMFWFFDFVIQYFVTLVTNWSI
ncbi:preprotein translocase subunit SecE [Psittacicella hinzii]|uniref:Preprotein translocase subunit SecE n=2 Tax=Psittacicella hinzii TaxID=2028575 RepID=A0A3A1YFV1_9GAMM|nr:preprotein translocase subunit SecE [Psittacicella hinzii]